MYVHGPVDRGTAVQLTALIRQLDENGLGLDDVRKGGAMIAGYPEPIGAKWVAKTGNLFDVIAKSRRPRTQTEDEYTEAVPR